MKSSISDLSGVGKNKISTLSVPDLIRTKGYMASLPRFVDSVLSLNAFFTRDTDWL